jgi:predicted O-methyltransferase YrrM
MRKTMQLSSFISFLVISAIFSLELEAQTLKATPEIDKKVEKFLAEQSGEWYDMNVPARDGKLLYDLILKGHYTSALEIGTSTGHSGIYIAWALSKTGGKLITIDIDKSRHNTAVFSDADKGWYINYFNDVDPKLVVGGCFTTHNIREGSSGRGGWNQEYLEYVRGLENYESTLNSDGGGVLISYKRAD